MAFTSDSKIVAVEDGSTIRLLDTERFEPLAEFQIPSGEIAESIRFTPDGRYLIAGGADQNPTHIWDLHSIRARLRELNLDWDHNVEAPANQLDPDKPIRLKLVFRGLAKFK